MKHVSLGKVISRIFPDLWRGGAGAHKVREEGWDVQWEDLGRGESLWATGPDSLADPQGRRAAGMQGCRVYRISGPQGPRQEELLHLRHTAKLTYL